MGQLYIVSTPIGNLADITYRAVDVLGAADRVLAEDTRRTSILLRHYGISTPLYSAHAHNEQARTHLLLEWLAAGEKVALVSDAGTPLISDPGARIVQAALDGGHEVVPVPGASSVLAALVASGLSPEPFTFFGFAARGGRERAALLERIAGLPHTAVLYEAPGRLSRLLRDLLATCGGERGVVVARELTKVHEEFVRGNLAELAAYYGEQERVRGEIVVLVAGSTTTTQSVASEEDVMDFARKLLDEGRSARDIARELAARFELPRNDAYQITLKAGDSAGGESA